MSLAFRTSAASSTNQITIPASAEIGDFAVLFDYANNGAGDETPGAEPTGWDNLFESDFFSDSGCVSVKLIEAGDPGSVISGIDGTTDRKVMLIFQGPILGYTVQDVDSYLNSGDPPSQTANAFVSSFPTVVVVAGFCDADGGVGQDFSTETPSLDAKIDSGDGDMRVGYKVYTSSPQDHTVDVADFGTATMLVSFYVEVQSQQDLIVSFFTNTNTFFAPQINLALVVPIFTNTSTFFAHVITLYLVVGFFKNTNQFFTILVPQGHGRALFVEGEVRTIALIASPSRTVTIPTEASRTVSLAPLSRTVEN